jgi:hypothetical protein
MIRHHRSLIAAFTLAALVAGVSTAAAERVRCRSKDYKYAQCRVSGRIQNVRVVDRHSDRACIQGRSFGWNGDRLWVNNGCDADFDVDLFGDGNGRPPYPGPGNGNGNGGGWPGGPGGGQWDNAPDWAIGDWRSTDRVGGRTQYLSVSRNGTASWRGNWSIQGRWTNGGIRFSDGTYIRISADGRRRVRVDHPTLGRVDFRR